MSTARELIRRSLVLIGVLPDGETPSASQLQDGLLTLNEMIDSWSTENLIIYSKTKEQFTTPSGNAAPTMGPTTGTFATTRPIRVEHVTIQSGNAEFPVQILNFDQWSQVIDKSLTSTFPTKVYLDFGSQFVTFNWFPIPVADTVINIYSEKALASFTANTTVDLPAGYMRAIRYNLAIELCPEFGTSATPEVVKIAQESKGNIKRINQEPKYMAADQALLKRRTFNIYTGE